MRNDLLNYNCYLKSEYGSSDREYLINKSNAKSLLSYLKNIKELLLSKGETMVINQKNQSYLYFLTEYKDDISFERDNIIVPEFENVLVRRINKNHLN